MFESSAPLKKASPRNRRGGAYGSVAPVGLCPESITTARPEVGPGVRLKSDSGAARCMKPGRSIKQSSLTPMMTSDIDYCLSTLVVFAVWSAFCYLYSTWYIHVWTAAERASRLREAPYLAPTNVEMQQKRAEVLDRAADLHSVMTEYGTLRSRLSKESREGLGPDLPHWDHVAAVQQAMKPEQYAQSLEEIKKQEQFEEQSAPFAFAFLLALLNWAAMWMIKRRGCTELVVALLWRTLFMMLFILAVIIGVCAIVQAEQAQPTLVSDMSDDSWEIVQKGG
ncbi:hypothetical protein LTR15_006622 [Elasticomyces elasticus]|nr:hypothetical protein LTR15_006622 [Elasticomyces elasticus]